MLPVKSMRRREGACEAMAAGLAAVAIVLTLMFSNPGGAGFALRESLFDAMIALKPRSGPPPLVKIIDIDSQTLARFGAWPWRRARIADVMEKITAARPRALAVDILFEGDDRLGPRAALRQLSEAEKTPALATPDLARLAESLPDDDKRLAAVLDRGVPVVLALAVAGAGAVNGVRAFPPLILASSSDAPVNLSPPRAQRLSGPAPALFDLAAGLGVTSLDVDADGKLRRFALMVEHGRDQSRQIQGGFALETLRAAEGAGTVVIDPASNRLEIGALKTFAPPNALMRFYPRPAGAWREHIIPAWRIMHGEDLKLNPETIVVLGSSAPEAGAYLPSAALGGVSTLFLQAEAIDQLRSGVWLKRIAGEWRAEYGLAVLAALLAIAAALTLPPLFAALAATLLMALTAGGAFALFAGAGVLADPAPAFAAILAGAAGASLALHNRLRANRTLIEARFSRYLDPAVVELLAREPHRLRIAGQRREITALFTDLEGFTPFSERTDPAELIATLDAYFETIAQIIVEHGGMVDKIVGDALHAFFNMPLDQSDHAERAVRCARAIHDTMSEFRNQPRYRALGLGRTRIGVDTGWASVGDVGGRNKLDYTAHGEAVNRAARLQTMARETPSGVLIGEGTASRLASLDGLKPLGTMKPRGLTQAQEVYTLA